jgi:glycosyltransferase involved in cell wall biosynthesis
MADGVSIEAAKLVDALHRQGWSVSTVAGAGHADQIVSGLDFARVKPLRAAVLHAALAQADIVVVENVLSLPLNLRAARALASELRGRKALLWHHDLADQRPDKFFPGTWPPDDPAWRHVTINELSREALARKGIDAVTVPNTLPRTLPAGRRGPTRHRLGVPAGARLVLQPTRAIPRKNVGAGIRFAEQLGAIYWLTGPAENGYTRQLADLLNGARCRVVRGLPAGTRMADAYAAADVVVFPSTWEGFGNPVIEAAAYGVPLAAGHYPVLAEIQRTGLHCYSIQRPDEVDRVLQTARRPVVDRNRAVVRDHFSAATLDAALDALTASFDDDRAAHATSVGARAHNATS